MADQVGFKIFTEPFTKMVDDKQKRMPRAAMWAVREAGRTTRKTARAKAPVLKSKTMLSHAQLQRGRRAGLDVSGYYTSGHDEKGRTSTAGTGPIPGLLRASIKSSRQLHRKGNEFTLKVWPSGPRTHLYAGKMEDRYHYMAAGDEAARAAFPAIARRAFERVWEK